MWLKNFWVALLAIAAVFSNGSCELKNPDVSEPTAVHQYNKEVQNTNSTQNTESISNYANNGRTMLHTFFGDIFANALRDLVIFSNTNENCTRDGQQFVVELNNQMPWAIQMYESSSKYPGNVLTGEVVELGNFDRCMSVSSERLGIYGAYVLVNLRFRPFGSEAFKLPAFDTAFLQNPKKNKLSVEPNTILWAVCAPDSCTGEDVRLSVDHVITPIFEKQNITVDIIVPPPFYTSRSSQLEYSNGVLFTWVIIIGSVMLTIIGSFYGLFTDQSKPKNKGFFKTFLYSYSIVDNMKNLVEDPKGEDYSIINGLKVMGIVQMICFHRLVLDLGAPSFNPDFFDKMYGSFWSGFLKTQIPVEIYFVVSGFLTYIKIEDHLRRGNSFNFLHLLTYRLSRIFPSYAIVILIFAFIFPYMGNGPLWQTMIYPEAEFCRKNWWTNLLFVNTYVNSYEMCMFHSWYLACDMHYFIIGIFLTYMIHKWKNIGLSMIGIIFAVSVYIPAQYIYENKQLSFIPVFRSDQKDVRHSEYFHNIYIRSEFRFSTYLIGMATAYIFLYIKKSKIKFSMNSKITGCILSFLMMYVCMAVTGLFYLPDVTYNPWYHVMCFTFQRIIYALILSYIIIVGLMSNFGFISRFFESKFCTAIARLSYVAYLVHLVVVFHNIAELRQPQYENFWTLIGRANFDLTITLVYTLFINLTIESPSRKIFNYIMNPFKNNHKISNSNVIERNSSFADNVIQPHFKGASRL